MFLCTSAKVHISVCAKKVLNYFLVLKNMSMKMGIIKIFNKEFSTLC